MLLIMLPALLGYGHLADWGKGGPANRADKQNSIHVAGSCAGGSVGAHRSRGDCSLARTPARRLVRSGREASNRSRTRKASFAPLGPVLSGGFFCAHPMLTTETRRRRTTAEAQRRGEECNEWNYERGPTDTRATPRSTDSFSAPLRLRGECHRLIGPPARLRQNVPSLRPWR